MPAETRVDALLALWRQQPEIAGQIVHWQTTPARPAHYEELPDALHPQLAAALRWQGINSLYSHQAAAWRAVQAGKNIVVATGTASGKTLCYNLPAVNAWLRDDQACALYLFPTKALAQDQQEGLARFGYALQQVHAERHLPTAIYDGDTPAASRNAIRTQTRLLLTNPDMLHIGILPHHTLWADFLRNLRFVVIDETHIYRGIFGSHVANLLRRLRRVAAFYGAYPQFILTSATIANPQTLAEKLIEAPVEVIQEDGSPSGERNFILYNPPITDERLGLRRSALAEAVRLTSDLLDYRVQTILFGRSRRTVEFILRTLRETRPGFEDSYQAYRSGYLARERRAIEHGLRDGTIQAVAATTALELGIDIGALSAAVMVGYPGSISAVRQQAGRAGRRQESAVAILVASASPLDQFLMRHPEYLQERSPEQALINPDNLLILLQHIRCAAFELPFRDNEPFGRLAPQTLAEMLEVLEQAGILHHSGARYYWMTDQYPANEISLRSTAAHPILLRTQQNDRWITIGEIDPASALWMVHPQAVYLHAGRTYRVEELDLEAHSAHLVEEPCDYFTEPKRQVELEKIEELRQQAVPGGSIHWGDILVTTQVTGFRRTHWSTRENLGESPLDLPATQLRTMGYWLELSTETVESLRVAGLWGGDANDYGANWAAQRALARARDRFICQICGTPEQGRAHHVHHKIPFRTFHSYLEANQLDNLITLCPNCHQRAELPLRIRSGLAGLGYVLNQLAPLSLMCDGGDLGVFTDPQSGMADGGPVVVVYDQIPAGIGLSETLYRIHSEVIAQAYELVSGCTCQDGCPSCVGPGGESGSGSRKETLAILGLLNGKILD